MLHGKVLTLWLLVFSYSSYASYIYEPYEDILARAELIVTGTIISKQYIDEENRLYKLFKVKIKQLIKGKSGAIEITVKSHGGCDKQGICVTGSNNYDFAIADQVYMMLKSTEQEGIYMSVRDGSTVSLVTDDGYFYQDARDLALIRKLALDANGDKPVKVDQVMKLVN